MNQHRVFKVKSKLIGIYSPTLSSDLRSLLEARIRDGRIDKEKELILGLSLVILASSAVGDVDSDCCIFGTLLEEHGAFSIAVMPRFDNSFQPMSLYEFRGRENCSIQLESISYATSPELRGFDSSQVSALCIPANVNPDVQHMFDLRRGLMTLIEDRLLADGWKVNRNLTIQELDQTEVGTETKDSLQSEIEVRFLPLDLASYSESLGPDSSSFELASVLSALHSLPRINIRFLGADMRDSILQSPLWPVLTECFCRNPQVELIKEMRQLLDWSKNYWMGDALSDHIVAFWSGLSEAEVSDLLEYEVNRLLLAYCVMYRPVIVDSWSQLWNCWSSVLPIVIEQLNTLILEGKNETDFGVEFAQLENIVLFSLRYWGCGAISEEVNGIIHKMNDLAVRALKVDFDKAENFAVQYWGIYSNIDAQQRPRPTESTLADLRRNLNCEDAKKINLTLSLIGSVQESFDREQLHALCLHCLVLSLNAWNKQFYSSKIQVEGLDVDWDNPLDDYGREFPVAVAEESCAENLLRFLVDQILSQNRKYFGAGQIFEKVWDITSRALFFGAKNKVDVLNKELLNTFVDQNRGYW